MRIPGTPFSNCEPPITSVDAQALLVAIDKADKAITILSGQGWYGPPAIQLSRVHWNRILRAAGWTEKEVQNGKQT